MGGANFPQPRREINVTPTTSVVAFVGLVQASLRAANRPSQEVLYMNARARDEDLALGAQQEPPLQDPPAGGPPCGGGLTSEQSARRSR